MRSSMFPWLRLIGQGALLSAAAAWAGYQYGSRVEAMRLDVTRLKIPAPRLRSGTLPFRIVQLSDFHYSPLVPPSLIQEAIVVSNALKPDLVVLTGDYLGHKPAEVHQLAPLLSRLEAPSGIVAILGNHDVRFAPATVSLALMERGITVLRNQGVLLPTPASPLFVGGLDDALYGSPNMPALMSGAPDDATVIILAHEPDIADYVAADRRALLQLSGHTHGGQLHFPIIGPPFIPSLGRRYLRGLHQVQNMWLYVSRGIGMSHFPVRWGSRPEIVEVTLLPGQGVPTLQTGTGRTH